MSERDPRHWGPFPRFDPASGTVIGRPLGQGAGYWAGAPGVRYDAQLDRFHVVYRLRRPRGVEPDRGAEIRIAASQDGIAFEDIWSGAKKQLDTTSIERCALARRPDGAWRLYVSYVDPADGRWQISLVEAQQPDQFDLASARPVLTAADIGAEEGKAGLSGSPTRVVKVFFPKREHKSEMLQGSLEEQLEHLVERLEGIV